ncbi:MAG: ArnT family glycosyltransferase [Armatimonadota bacterium]
MITAERFLLASEDTSRVWVRTWLVVLLAGCLVMLAGAPLPNFHSDSALYGRIAKNIVASGDWLTLWHQSGWMVDKPPLSIWLMALSFHLGGTSDAMLRLWNILAALALVMVTYRIARLGAGEEESLIAALIMATMFQPFYLSLAPQQDVPLALCVALAFYAYLRYRQEGHTIHAALMGLWVALAVLTKGVLSLAAVVTIVVADLLLARVRKDRAGVWRWSQIGLAAAVCVAIAAPWFVVGAMRQGMSFINTFFLMGPLGLGRFFTPKQAPLPYWLALAAYVPMLAFWMMPWTGFLPGAVSAARRRFAEWPPSLRLCVLWAGLYLLALSLSPGDKVYRHLHPLYAPLAVLAARSVVTGLGSPRGLRTAAFLSLLAGMPILIAGGVFLAGQGPAGSTVYRPIAVPFLVALAVAITAFAALGLMDRRRPAVVALAAGTILAYGVLEWQISQTWEWIWPWRRVAATIHSLYRPGDRVMVVGILNGEAQYMFYHLDVPLAVADDAALDRAWTEGRVFALVSSGSLPRLQERFRPGVLVQMPAGWVLVTNR